MSMLAKEKSFQCNKVWHWRRTYTGCSNGLRNGVGGVKLFVCETSYFVFSTSWILDLGISFHICTSNQNLFKSWLLKKPEVLISVGSRASVTTTAIGIALVKLSSSYILGLRDYFCYQMSKRIMSLYLY